MYVCICICICIYLYSERKNFENKYFQDFTFVKFTSLICSESLNDETHLLLLWDGLQAWKNCAPDADETRLCIFFRIPSDRCVWCMRIILWVAYYFCRSNNIHTLQKLHCKNFWWNYYKNRSFKPYLGNKEQKFLFVVVSQLDLRIDFNFAPFFCVPDRARANKIARSKDRVRRSKFVQH